MTVNHGRWFLLNQSYIVLLKKSVLCEYNKHVTPHTRTDSGSHTQNAACEPKDAAPLTDFVTNDNFRLTRQMSSHTMKDIVSQDRYRFTQRFMSARAHEDSYSYF